MMLLGWGDVLKPNQGTPQSIGFYSSGCISGADALSKEGTGFQVMRLSRNRFYGHPSTIQFVQNLGATLSALNSGVLVGDMSQPRGGPMVSGHASHQVGLDVDIWFWTHPEINTRSLTLEERDTLPFVSMLDADQKVDPAKFTADQILKLKIAALSPNVERIFINPAIKSYLCAITPAKESAWLHALRPWAGHHEHFHVRMACPKDSPLCTPQAPVPAGNGCSEIEAFHDETPLALPAQCEAVLKDPSVKTQAVWNL